MFEKLKTNVYEMGDIDNGVYGYQTLFAEFDYSAGHFLYYSMMYYGGIGQVRIYGIHRDYDVHYGTVAQL
ncbi:hypothetical protein PENSUB_5515 [Penicillium subrubescens]|uniref:Uncharacterized protein n=1 Tax=Penicillium subrubescens TaxID=1316194 RepID=A0A1Q5U819_9EURO|nr:hypothetical protein PENSUB_5515 [Penicillium subrubescens]